MPQGFHVFSGPQAEVSLSIFLRKGSRLRGRPAEFCGRPVLLATHDQLATALALIELDGLANRLMLCSPDVPLEHLDAVIAGAAVDAIIMDRGPVAQLAAGIPLVVSVDRAVTRSLERFEPRETE
jgi:hypothetical protein